MDNTIHRFKNARIAMFVGDHPPVHVHLLGPGFKVSIVENHEYIMRVWVERGAKR